MTTLTSKLVWGGLVVAIAGAVTTYFVLREPHHADGPKLAGFMIPATRTGPPPVLFPAAPFNFVDQNGRSETNSQLHGRIWIADFIFTHCAGNCPKVTEKMVELQKTMEDPNIRFVSFSVDPERDDPATLKQYAESHNPDSRWALLRPPDRKTVMNVASKMAAIARPEDEKDAVLHTDFFLLIDQDGKVRGLYDSKNDADVERLKADVNAIKRQSAVDEAAKHPHADGQP